MTNTGRKASTEHGSRHAQVRAMVVDAAEEVKL